MVELEELEERILRIEQALRHAHLLAEPAPTIISKPNMEPAPPTPPWLPTKGE
jgi:hypothetical protein